MNISVVRIPEGNRDIALFLADLSILYYENIA